jgi:hypothetical protein
MKCNSFKKYKIHKIEKKNIKKFIKDKSIFHGNQNALAEQYY